MDHIDKGFQRNFLKATIRNPKRVFFRRRHLTVPRNILKSTSRHGFGRKPKRVIKSTSTPALIGKNSVFPGSIFKISLSLRYNKDNIRALRRGDVPLRIARISSHIKISFGQPCHWVTHRKPSILIFSFRSHLERILSSDWNWVTDRNWITGFKQYL